MTDIRPETHNGMAPKRVENRSYRPPQALISGGLLALHNGNNVERSWTQELSALCGRLVGEQPLGIVAVCRCYGYERDEMALDPLQRFWWNGPYGWLLKDFAVLERPIPMVGHRQYRLVETALARRLRGEWIKAREAGKLLR